MDTFNAFLTAIGDLLLAPFRSRPAGGLVFWSVVTGIVMTYAFGKTSNQQALRKAADAIRAQLFAIKLFKEDLVVTFQCQVAILKATAARLFHSMVPMLVMMVPLLVVLTQLAMRFERRPLLENEQAVITMHVKPDRWKETRDVKLKEGERFVVETDGLRDERNATILWRVRATGSESETMQWRLGEELIEKNLPMAPNREQLKLASARRPSGSFWDRVLYPAERSFTAASPIEAIDLQLAARETPLFGWDVPWWATFFLVSVVIAFIAGKFLGVQY